MIYGAILAGGVGKRIERYSIPKQFITIGGKPIIVLTIRQFLENKRMDMIYVAVNQDWIVYAQNLFQDSFSLEELEKIRIVTGGKERLDSFSNIIQDIFKKTEVKEDDVLICHDAVRPFVKQQMIDDCINATLKYDAALTVIPVSDTIHISHSDSFIDGALERKNLYNGQTPSGFKILLLNQILNTYSEEEKSRVTGTTQLLLKYGQNIRIVNGHTSNFKITTDNDLDVADRIIRSVQNTRNINLLDCTLRDGGIVINFDFGFERMRDIKSSLEDAGVKYIECGYIDEKTGSETGRTCFVNERAVERFLTEAGKQKGAAYLAMIDYGTFDVHKLQQRTSEGIDGIRLAFHKENWREAVEWGKIIIEKGYELYIQPMVTMRYSDEELRELIALCNKELSEAKAFYIVDSFGQMDNITLLHRLEIADNYVCPSMSIGFHAHNNRQMAFSNAATFIQFPAKHEMMLDSSIMGMGKGAGNLCTELIMPLLIAQGGHYSANGLYDEISTYFSKVLQEFPWGYSLDYYLSSIYACTPSYIKIFVKDNRVTTDVLIELLKNMPEKKKAACDKKFAFEYLNNYFINEK